MCFIWGLYSVFGLAQSETEIKLAKNPFSVERHMISYYSKNPNTGNLFFPYLRNLTKNVAIYSQNIITQKHFKSLKIVENKKQYDVIIKMDPKGKAALDKATTDLPDNPIVYVCNDTIYQVRKEKEPILDGTFTISGLTFSQKEQLVSYYKDLPSMEVQKAFYEMIRERNIHKADSLIRMGALVKEGENIGKNAFRQAFKKNDTLVTNFLKKHHFQPNANNLSEALNYKDLRYIKNHFISIKKTSKFQEELNKTFFSEAKKNTLDVVKLLVELGADVNYKNKEENTVLPYTAAYNTPEVFRYLLERKIEYKQELVLGFACYYNTTDFIDFILNLDEFDVNLKFPNGQSVLHMLLTIDIQSRSPSHKDGLAKLSYLLDKGADPSYIDNYGNTILHLLTITAVGYTDREDKYTAFKPELAEIAVLEAAKKMIHKGLNPEIKNKDGLTPIGFAKSYEETSKRRSKRYDMATDQLLLYLESLD